MFLQQFKDRLAMSKQHQNSGEFSSFADLCARKDSLAPETRHTVEMLLKAAGTDDGSQAERILSNKINLNLSDGKISDITPLKYFPNLQYLDLAGNQISDLAPLKYLTDMTCLNIGNNAISDLTPLKSLTKLDSLYLDKNLISDIRPLRSLSHLTWLNLVDTQISNLKPLKNLSNLTNLMLSLTAAQKDILKGYAQKWAVPANFTDRIDRSRAAAAVKAAYNTVGLPAPEIIFCSSPHAAIAQLKMLNNSLDRNDLIEQLYGIIEGASHLFNWRELIGELGSSSETKENDIFPMARWENHLFNELFVSVDCEACSIDILGREYPAEKLCLAEFLTAEFRMVFSQDIQEVLAAFKLILAECGWIYPFEKVCYVCDRPTKLCLDSEYQLHAEGEAAIEFSDGYKIYSYHGVTLPEKYGQVHPQNWRLQWLLEEENAELRRVLIQGIGYARICQELQATELDCYEEYTLLRIDADIDAVDRDAFDGGDREPIYLLKMTCPSTGFIHALRVPPEIQSAREAIRWTNWDVDYEEFSVQT